MSCFCKKQCNTVAVNDQIYLKCNECYFFANVKSDECPICHIKMLCGTCTNPNCSKCPEKKRKRFRIFNSYK